MQWGGVQEKYGVRLATQEKGRLRKMIRAGRSSAQAITRARILIKIDEGWTAPQVATATLGIDEGLWDVRWSWCRRSTESGWQHRKRDGSGR